MNTQHPRPLMPPRSPDFSAPREGVFPQAQMGSDHHGLALLSDHVDQMGPGPEPARPAVLVISRSRRFYFFWIEICHTNSIRCGSSDYGGSGAVPVHLGAGRGLVARLHLPTQTVWTDLFILVERWIEGDRNARVRLHKAKWDVRKWRLAPEPMGPSWMAISVANGGAGCFLTFKRMRPHCWRDLVSLSAACCSLISQSRF